MRLMKTELTINVRPLRHAYFIAEDDLKRFTEVATFCCTQWGGINNLIIPIPTSIEADSTSIHKENWLFHIIKQRCPDISINALREKEQSNTIARSLIGKLTFEFPDKFPIPWETFREEDRSFHPLNIGSFQDMISIPTLPVAIFDYTPSVLEEAVRTAAFGKIWPGQEKEYHRAYQIHRWPVYLSEASLRDQLLTDPYASVINLTLKELDKLASVSPFPSLHFDVVIAQNVRDLCWFWNLRASSFGHHWLPDRRILLLSKEQFFNDEYLEPLTRIIRERRTHPESLALLIEERSARPDIQAKLIRKNLDVVFHHSDESISQFLRTHNEFQAYQSPLYYGSSNASNSVVINTSESSVTGEATTQRPITYMENLVEELCIYYEYGGSNPTISVELSEGTHSLLVTNIGPQLRAHEGTVYFSIQGLFWNQFPCHPSVAKLIMPDASFDLLPNSIQLSSPRMLSTTQTEHVSLTIPSKWDMYQAYFRAQGYEVSPSDKSFYANGLMGIAGGLEQAEILRSLIAYRILDTLADKSTPKLAQEVRRQLNQQGISLPQSFEEYLQGLVTSTGVIPQFKRNPRTFTKIKEALDRDERPQCLKVLSELVRIKAVQRGLDVKCPYCQTTIWYGISDLDERMKCLGCLETFDLPLTENALDPIDRSFQYSLNPLANRAMDQDVLPVITALLTLKTVHAPLYHMVPGMNFKPVGSTHNTGDFDFVYIYKHELYGGECKTGEMLSQKDIDTARVAHQLGFRAFFFVTVITFRDEAKELIRSYQQELANSVNMDHPFTVVVLDRRTLFEGGEPLSKEIPQ